MMAEASSRARIAVDVDQNAWRDSVYAKWTRMGAAQGVLGSPTAEECSTPDGRGRIGSFQFGAIWWSSNSGAHAISGPILETWLASGRETGPLGYPTGDIETCAGGGQFCDFENGVLFVARASDRGARPLEPIRLTGPFTPDEVLADIQILVDRVVRTAQLPPPAKGMIVNPVQFRSPRRVGSHDNGRNRCYEVGTRVELVMPGEMPNVESSIEMDFDISIAERSTQETRVMIGLRSLGLRVIDDTARASLESAFAGFKPRLIAAGPANVVSVKTLADGHLVAYCI